MFIHDTMGVYTRGGQKPIMYIFVMKKYYKNRDKQVVVHRENTNSKNKYKFIAKNY